MATPPDDLDPQDDGQDQQPDAGLDARIAKHVSDAVDEKVMPALDRIAAQQAADMKELFQRIPNEEQVVSRVVDQLKKEAEQAATEWQQAHGQESNAAAGGARPSSDSPPANGHRSPIETLEADQHNEFTELSKYTDETFEEAKAFSPDRMKDWIGLAQAVSNALMPWLDFGISSRFRLKQMEMLVTSPEVYLQSFYQREPQRAMFLINAWANQFNPLGQIQPVQQALMAGINIGKAGRAYAGAGSSPDNPLVVPQTPGLGWPGVSDGSSATPGSGSGPNSAPNPGSGSVNSPATSWGLSAARTGTPESSSDQPKLSFAKHAVRKTS